MEIIVYGKAGCGKCESAKKNIAKMGFNYTYRDIADIISAENLPEDWRNMDYAAIKADYTFLDSLPMIKVGDGLTLNYSEAMLKLKKYRKEARVQTTDRTQAEQETLQLAETA